MHVGQKRKIKTAHRLSSRTSLSLIVFGLVAFGVFGLIAPVRAHDWTFLEPMDPEPPDHFWIGHANAGVVTSLPFELWFREVVPNQDYYYELVDVSLDQVINTGSGQPIPSPYIHMDLDPVSFSVHDNDWNPVQLDRSIIIEANAPIGDYSLLFKGYGQDVPDHQTHYITYNLKIGPDFSPAFAPPFSSIETSSNGSVQKPVLIYDYPLDNGNLDYIWDISITLESVNGAAPDPNLVQAFIYPASPLPFQARDSHWPEDGYITIQWQNLPVGQYNLEFKAAGSDPTAMVRHFAYTIIRQDPSADTTPPNITNLTCTPSFDGFTATWNTDEPADGRINFDLNTPPNGLWVSEPAGFRLNHSVTISGQHSETDYYYKAESCDNAPAHNCTTSPPKLCRTTSAPADFNIDAYSETDSNAEIVTVQSGITAVWDVKLDSVNGWIGNIDLTSPAHRPEIDGKYRFEPTPATLAADDWTISKFRIDTADIPVGSYTGITVRGRMSASPNTVHDDTNLRLIVAPPDPDWGFVPDPDPRSQDGRQGDSVEYILKLSEIVPTYSSLVDLTLESVAGPAGGDGKLTLAVPIDSVTPTPAVSQRTATISVAEDAPLGDYTLTFKGAGTDSLSRTHWTAVTLNVLAASIPAPVCSDFSKIINCGNATLIWTTDLASNSIVYYCREGTGPGTCGNCQETGLPGGFCTKYTKTESVTSHAVQFTDLTSGDYRFMAESCTESGSCGQCS